MKKQDAGKAKAAVDKAFEYEIETGKVEPLIIEKELSIVALVGDNMKSHPGISGKMFGALGRNGVNVRAIAQGSSERNISAVIATGDVKKAINVLHEEFFETTYKQVNLFIAGAGNVGEQIAGQLQQQHKYLQENLRLQVRVVGLANSKKMLFNDEGIDLNNWKELLQAWRDNESEQIYCRSSDQKICAIPFLLMLQPMRNVATCYDQIIAKKYFSGCL